MSNNIIIRKARNEDANGISLLYKMVWDEEKGVFPKKLIQARQPGINEMEKWLSRDTYFIAELNNKTVGVVGCFMKFGNCKLVHMVVRKDYRRKKIGSILLEQVEDFAIKNKAYKIWLDTSKRLKESIEFYNSRGFRLVGEMKKHF